MIYIKDDFILNDDDLDFDSDSDEQMNDDSTALDVNNESEYEDSETETETKSAKDGYDGIRIYSTIADKDRDKFFKVEINGKKKYIHKQTTV
ncbi:unnamed protein product, partial [Rotaria sp. Silwood1]